MNQPELRQSEVRHRRQTVLQLVLPMLLVVLLVVACVVLVLLFPRRLQVGIVADIMVTTFMLCPAVICMFPLALGMLIAVFGMNRVHDGLARPVRRVADFSHTLSERTISTTDMINQKTIDLSARLGGVYKLLSVLESEEYKSDGSDSEDE